MNKHLVLLLTIFQITKGDVLLVNIFNLTDSEVTVSIENQASGRKSSSGSTEPSKVLIGPRGKRLGLNIDLFSLKTQPPSIITISKYNDFHYSPSGQTPQIDLIIDTDVVRVYPSGPETKEIAKRGSMNIGKKAKNVGDDWIFDRVVVKSIDNKSRKLVEVHSGLKHHPEKLVVYNHISVEPGKKEKSNIILDRGQELVINISGKEGREKRAEYLPSGKADTLDIVIDEHENAFVREHKQPTVAVPFDIEK